jgi:integrase
VARSGQKLSPMLVRKLKEPGVYADGRNLYLHVGEAAATAEDPLAAKSWLFRYMRQRRAREMGLGPLHTVSLAKAREWAQDARLQLLSGIDPLEAKKAKRAGEALEAAKSVTFSACAAKYIAANRAGWRNAKHALQWDTTLATYAYPVIGELSVGAIATGHVTKVLEPIWATRSETASRVRGRIEAVLEYAKVHGWRDGENPARWKGHLENVLPKRSKMRAVEHHAALPWQEIGDFMAELTKQEGVAALALRFTILTAARTGEVVGARWSEIDLPAALWVVPGARMKAGREHRVPLCESARAVLRAAARLRERDAPDSLVFPGGKAGRRLNNMANPRILARMNRDDLTAHGFRSTFRDWAAETGQSADIAEAALAHTLGSKVVQAYQRGDLLERRRRLMAAWDAFCGRPAGVGDVVELSAARVMA